MNKLKIIPVQKNINSIITQIKSMKESTLILYENCISELVLGGKILPIRFDTMLYSLEENVLLLFLKNGKLNKEQIKELLNKEGIDFSIISFIYEKDNYYSTSDFKELVFARNKQDVSRELKDSKEKEIDSCTYHPNIYGIFSLNYINSIGKKEKFFSEPIRGFIELEDKIILINKQKEKDLPSKEEVLETFVENDINVLVKKETKIYGFINHNCKRKILEK